MFTILYGLGKKKKKKKQETSEKTPQLLNYKASWIQWKNMVLSLSNQRESVRSHPYISGPDYVCISFPEIY